MLFLGLLLVVFLFFPATVNGQISQVQGWCGLDPVLDSCLAGPYVGMTNNYVCQVMPYDLNDQPIFSGVQYEWGVSSGGSLVGKIDLQDDGRVARFSPVGAGEGVVWVNVLKNEQIVGEKSFPIIIYKDRLSSKIQRYSKHYGVMGQYGHEQEEGIIYYNLFHAIPKSGFPDNLPCCEYERQFPLPPVIRCDENKLVDVWGACLVYSSSSFFSPCDKEPDFYLNGLDFAKLLLEER
jgi:hypothetical protein